MHAWTVANGSEDLFLAVHYKMALKSVVGPVIRGGTPAVIAWMRSRGLLASNATCICGRAMRERRRSDISDGISWYCPSCKKTKTIRKDSFYAKSMTLQEWLILIYWWARQYPSKHTSEEAEVDKNTACDVYRWLREVCSTTLLTTPIVLGGPGVVCQIDESLFKHKPKVHVQSIIYIYTMLW